MYNFFIILLKNKKINVVFINMNFFNLFFFIFVVICPILALAVHVVCMSSSFSGGTLPVSVFTGKADGQDAEQRFSAWLNKELASVEPSEALTTLGGVEKSFGTHSFRKGIATFLSSFMDGPSIISIFQRLGWSIGNVQQRYIGEGEGGNDQYIGRIACGLPPCDDRFATLPPHFLNAKQALTEEQYIGN
jgi:hypothetical protein